MTDLTKIDFSKLDSDELLKFICNVCAAVGTYRGWSKPETKEFLNEVLLSKHVMQVMQRGQDAGDAS